MNSRLRLQQGFTLLEVMIALMVFALISMMAWQIIHGAMENAAFTDKQTANLSQLQLTWSRLERDLTQMLPRGVNGDEQALRLSENALAFTTQDNLASFGRPQEPDILRVTWRLQDNTLWRDVAPAIDLANMAQGVQVPVLEHVKSWQWRFFAEGWRDAWAEKSAIPQGVELTVTLENDETWRWVFVISDGWPMPTEGAESAAPTEGTPDPATPQETTTPSEAAQPAAGGAPAQPAATPGAQP